MPLSGIAESLRLYDAMHKDRGSNHMFRIDGSHRDDFLDFGNRRFRRHGHDRIEISRGEPVRQIAQFIGLLRFDECKIGVNGHFQNAALALDHALFLSSGHFGSDAHSRVKPAQPRGSSAHAFAENPLRHEFERDFLRGIALQKIVRMRPGESRNHVFDLIVLEHQPKFAIARSAIVADCRNVFGSLPHQRLNQVVGKTRATDSSKHDSNAIGNICNRLVKSRKNLSFHPALIAPALGYERKRAATPLSTSHRPVSVPPKSCLRRTRKSASSSTSISSRGLRRKITCAPRRSPSPTCFAKLPIPKCDGNNAGGMRRIALVPVPSRDGTMTSAGSSHSTVSKSSISLACTSGTSSGIRSSPVTPRASQSREAVSTESLSETCCSSRNTSQPFSSAMRIAGS